MALATHSVDQHVSPLFSLGVDVWYIVLDILREEPEPDEEEDDDEDPDSFWKPKRIARRLRHLPDLINMSSTCTWFRDLLAPTILGNLELYNTAKSAQSITAISRGKHAACVKTLRYIGICETGMWHRMTTTNARESNHSLRRSAELAPGEGVSPRG